MKALSKNLVSEGGSDPEDNECFKCCIYGSGLEMTICYIVYGT